MVSEEQDPLTVSPPKSTLESHLAKAGKHGKQKQSTKHRRGEEDASGDVPNVFRGTKSKAPEKKVSRTGEQKQAY